jgi:hypothetical protein
MYFELGYGLYVLWKVAWSQTTSRTANLSQPNVKKNALLSKLRRSDLKGKEGPREKFASCLLLFVVCCEALSEPDTHTHLS